MESVNATLRRGLMSTWKGMQGAAQRVASASVDLGAAPGSDPDPTPRPPARLEADMVDLLKQRNVFQLQLAAFRRADEAQQTLLDLRA